MHLYVRIRLHDGYRKVEKWSVTSVYLSLLLMLYIQNSP